jgi:hypothetical protein
LTGRSARDNCSKEVTGKFCAECGTPAAPQAGAPEQAQTGSLQNIGGKDDEKPKTEKRGFWDKAMEQSRLNVAARQEEQLELKKRIKQMDRVGVAYCPKCYSTSLSANKKGFGVGKAIVGAALTGGIGLVAGNINAKNVLVTCLKCGHQFKPGKK